MKHLLLIVFAFASCDRAPPTPVVSLSQPAATTAPASSVVETEPEAAQSSDDYASTIAQFLHARWSKPSSIAQKDAAKLCATFQLSINGQMVVWHVRSEPMRSSGDAAFDESVRAILQKLVDERVALPEPPSEVASGFKGRTVRVTFTGDVHGDSSKCATE